MNKEVYRKLAKAEEVSFLREKTKEQSRYFTEKYKSICNKFVTISKIVGLGKSCNFNLPGMSQLLIYLFLKVNKYTALGSFLIRGF